MNYQIDRKIEVIFGGLISEILSDYVLMRAGKAMNPGKKLLLESMFSRVEKGGIKPLLMAKTGSEDIGGILEESYFSNQLRAQNPLCAQEKRNDQITFLDSLKNQVFLLTNGLLNPEFIFPQVKIEEGGKEPTVTFNDRQKLLIDTVLMRSAIAEVENSNIHAAQPESGKSKNTNPFEAQGNEVLIMGESGEYDTVITLDEIQIITANFKQFPQKSKSEIILEVLSEHGKKPLLSKNGEVIPFSSVDLPIVEAKEAGAFCYDISYLERALNLRLGRKMQMDFVIASHGEIIPGSGAMKINVPGAGHAVAFDASAITIDASGGTGNNLSFVLVDRRGGPAFIDSVHFPSSRSESDFIHSLHPSMASEPDRFDFTTADLKLPNSRVEEEVEKHSLSELYQEAQAPEEHEVAGEKQNRPNFASANPTMKLPQLETGREKATQGGIPIVIPFPKSSFSISHDPAKQPSSLPQTSYTKTSYPKRQKQTERILLPREKERGAILAEPRSLNPTRNITEEERQAEAQRYLLAQQEQANEAQAKEQEIAETTQGQTAKTSFFMRHKAFTAAATSLGSAAAVSGAAGLFTIFSK